MNKRMNKNRVISSLICLMLCICLTACAGQASSEGASGGSPSKKFDISIPEEITMEFFGVNLLEINRPMWEEHIFLISGLSENDYLGNTLPVGDYEVLHNYLNFENKGNFSSSITYNGDSSGAAQLLFDENDNLTKIDIRADMGSEFSTSFLNIGDNVKEYFDSFKTGLWDKFLSGEKIVVEKGWVVRHSTTAGLDDTYDVLQVANNDIHISYIIKNELVDYIILGVNAAALGNSVETEASVYNLDTFDFYINGTDIAKMSAAQWLEFFNFSTNTPEEVQFWQQWMSILDFSEDYFKRGTPPAGKCTTVLAGEEMVADFYYTEDYEYKSMLVILYPLTEAPASPGADYAYDTSGQQNMIEFSISKEGYFNVNLHIFEDCPMITSNYIMPGDNIRTFLNSFEDGLYEKIVSLDAADEYRVGPYCFRFFSEPEITGGVISIEKDDQRAVLPVEIRFEDETVTMIHRSYNGTVTGFSEEPSMW